MTEDRRSFFEAVYRGADGAAERVPWADMKPKQRIAGWIEANPGLGRTAIDVGCGLGDHAEAFAAAGWQTVAFDFSAEAIGWARKRFPGSTVDYRVADLFAPPVEWLGAFDLVNECYTIQSLSPEIHDAVARAITTLVRPGGRLLVYTRGRDEGAPAAGPPWPLTPSESSVFADLGFTLELDESFDIVRPDRTIPHRFSCWRR